MNGPIGCAWALGKLSTWYQDPKRRIRLNAQSPAKICAPDDTNNADVARSIVLVGPLMTAEQLESQPLEVIFLVALATVYPCRGY